MVSDPLAVLRARRAEIAREIELLRGEDADLATAENVLGRYANLSRPGQAPVPAPRRKSERPGSQREFVMDVLLDCDPPWLQTGEILEAVARRWNHKIPAQSLRPLLSGMKREGVIARRGRLVALSSRAVGKGV